MERKISGKSLVVFAAASAAAMLAAKDASADRFALELTEPRDHLAEILRVEGPSIVNTQIDETRKSVRVAASPGSPVNVQVGCPSDWRLDSGAEPAATSEHGVVHGTLPRTGVHNAALFAPVRVGETQTARLACVKGDDREDLAVAVTAVAGAPDDDPSVGDFSYRGNDYIPPFERPGPGMPVELAASMLDVDGDIGGLFSAEVDPVANGTWWGHFPIGLTYRVGRIHEEVNARDGSKKEVSQAAHCGFIGGGWNPILNEHVVDVRAEVEAGMGICGAEAIKTGPNTEVPEVTDVALRGAVGIQVGGQHLAMRVGVDGVRSDKAALQNLGVNMGALVRF